MAVKINLGHKLELAIAYLDQNGNPMLTAPTVDAAPAWANSTSATETLLPATNGLSCEATTVAVGNDTVSLTLAVGGTSFTAVLDVTVAAAEVQVLTSVAIEPTVS